MPQNKNFNGDKKIGKWFLQTYEHKLKMWLVPKVPRCIETYHLTMLTIVWSLLIIIFSWLARYDTNYLWGASLMIFLQYITDLLDGEVGRQQNTGLIKWGYYMDHLLDYFFLCSILIGYGLLLPMEFQYSIFFVQAILSAFMINAFLSFAATNQFKISHLGIGPTEIRIIFIVVNSLIILFGKTYMAIALPYILGFCTMGLFVIIYKTQRQLWDIDMKNK